PSERVERARAPVLRPACSGAAPGVRPSEQQGAAGMGRQHRLQGAHRRQHHLSPRVQRGRVVFHRRRACRPGDGEVNGTAVETSLTGTFEFHARKDLRWRLPRAQTPTHLITFGLDVDLDVAARTALNEMLDWIVVLTNLSRDEAYSLSSFAVDLHITQTVNNV